MKFLCQRQTVHHVELTGLVGGLLPSMRVNFWLAKAAVADSDVSILNGTMALRENKC